MNGKLTKRIGKLQSPEQCRVLIRDHHEAYVDWTEYQENVETLRRNAPRRPESDTMTSARGGAGLLVGLLRCGHCGRKLSVNYWGRSGTSPRYICKGSYAEAGDGCFSFAATLVEKDIEQQVLETLSAIGVEASILARDSVLRTGNEKAVVLERRAQQLRYEASRAFDQYNEVDPRNRLAAAELERRWNVKLAADDEAEAVLAAEQQSHAPLDEQQLGRLRYLGAHFEEAWKSPDCSGAIKKKIVRTVIEEVVVCRDANELVFVVHWNGGVHTELRFDRPAAGSHVKTSTDAIEIIRSLAPRYPDSVIAAVLNLHAMTTGQGKKWNSVRVTYARRRYEIHPEFTPAEAMGLLGLKRAATYCGVSQATLHKLIDAGLVRNNQTVSRAPYEIPQTDLESEPVKSALAHLRATGRLELPGELANRQQKLFE